ncbi:MAG: serine/threonine-protein kinase [Polyangia bacterium]|nr:serine/threonine-protein kinase [Polyangia bacterium]
MLRLLASGGMGAIYEVEHIGFGKHFAMKLLLPELAQNLEVTARFEREAKAASAIGHPNIIEITDVGETDAGLRFIVMELLVGEDLAGVLKRLGALPLERAVEIVSQVLLGLQAAHSAGIVHRDLKPENVFVCLSPTGGETVKLLDFGISKIAGTDEAKLRLTSTGLILGTPYYMSPEQAKGSRDLDHRADIYSVGVLLYEAVTGRRPYQAENITSLIFQIINGQIPPPSSLVSKLPEDLENVMLTALANEPDQRFQSASEFREALLGQRVVRRPALVTGARMRVSTPQDGFLPTIASGSTPGVGSGLAVEAPPKRRPVALIASLAILIGVGAGLGIWYFSGAGGGGKESSGTQVQKSQEDAQAPPRMDGAPTREPERPAQVKITVRATPQDAKLTVDGNPVSENPFFVPRSDKKHVLEVAAPGHKSQSHSFQATESQSFVVTLDTISEPGRPPGRIRVRIRPGPGPRPADPRPGPMRRRIETTTDI